MPRRGATRPLLMPSPSGASRSFLVIAAIVIGVLSSLVLIGVDGLRDRWSSENITLANKMDAISASLAASRLWTEAALRGDPGAVVRSLSSLSPARKESGELADQGLGSGPFSPSSPLDSQISSRFQRLHRSIESFAAVTQERLREAKSRGATAVPLAGEQRDYEHAFASLAAETAATTQAIEQRGALVRGRSRLLGHLLQVSWVGLVVLALAALLSRERRKHEAEAALREREIQILRIQKLEAVGRLAGGIAHDINNYLAAISAQSELAKRQLDGDPGLVSRMDSIFQTSQKASTLIQRVLAFGRRQPTQPEIVDLNHVVDGLDAVIRRWVGEELRLEKHLEPELWPAKIDPAQVEQIIVNLLVNARDATPSGGLVVISTANVTLDETYWRRRPVIVPGDYVQISVSDTGCGIPPDIQDKVFDPFFSTKNDQERSGLGLATVYGIVKQNAGNVWLYSEPGLGTTVKVYLPRSRETGKPAPDRGEVESGNPKLDARILLVEDNDEFRASTCEILASLGYAVSAARNGEQALAALEASTAPIDLLITDVIMPGLSGVDLARRVREKIVTVPILFISAFNDRVLAEHGLEGARASFLQKPFSAARLAKEVRGILDRPLPTAIDNL